MTYERSCQKPIPWTPVGLAPFLAALKLEDQEAVPMDRLEMGTTLGDISL
jgi:hypothetical protein